MLVLGLLILLGFALWGGVLVVIDGWLVWLLDLVIWWLLGFCGGFGLVCIGWWWDWFLVSCGVLQGLICGLVSGVKLLLCGWVV